MDDTHASSPTDALRPLAAAEFAQWQTRAISDYAEEKVRSGEWRADQAPEQAQAAFDALLPQGLHSPGQHLYAIVGGAGQAVGVLWFAREDWPAGATAFVYDLVVWPAHRRQGHARRALRALEVLAQRLGCSGLGLHVFGHNRGARALYESLGFAPTNVRMYKPVAQP